LAEFGGKGDRQLTTADGSRPKAVGRKQESGSDKLIAEGRLRNLGCWITGWGDTEMGKGETKVRSY